MKCTIDESLTLLTVEKVHGGKAPLSSSTSEVALALDLSEEVKTAMRETGFERKVYGFRLQMKGKVYELATESLEVRDGWTNMMKTIIYAYLDFLKSDSLWRYVKLQCILKEADFKCHDSSYHLKRTEMTVRVLESDLESARLDICGLVLNSLITKLEIIEESRRLAGLPGLVQELEISHLQAVQRHDSAMQREMQGNLLEKALKLTAETQVWKLVLRILSLESVLRLRGVNKKLRRLSSNLLKSQEYWSSMSELGLEPRATAWLLYCREFCPVPTSAVGVTVSSDVLAEIQKDVSRTRPDTRSRVKNILKALCSIHEEVG